MTGDYRYLPGRRAGSELVCTNPEMIEVIKKGGKKELTRFMRLGRIII